jgi:hypothetical protein
LIDLGASIREAIDDLASAFARAGYFGPVVIAADELGVKLAVDGTRSLTAEGVVKYGDALEYPHSSGVTIRLRLRAGDM